MKYYIFRHGATRASTTDNVYHGDEIVNADILKSGIPAVKRMGEHLKKGKVENFYTSPFKRCIQTMEIIKNETAKNYTPEERLGEFREDLNEPFETFARRIKDFINEISLTARRSFEQEGVAICTHGAGLSAIKHLLLNGIYKYENLMDFPSSGILWICEEKNIKEINFN